MKGTLSRPSSSLMNKVTSLAAAKQRLPMIRRLQTGAWGIHCRVKRLPDGSIYYQAGGKYISKLQFTAEPDGSTTVRKYEPGDWERDLDLTVDHALSWVAYSELEENLNRQLDADAEFEDWIPELERKAEGESRPVWFFLGNVYAIVGRFKDAERAYVKLAEQWPTVYSSHQHLGGFYLHALSNSKGYGLDTHLVAPMWQLVRVEHLERNDEDVFRLAKQSFELALDYAPPKWASARSMLLRALHQLERIGNPAY